MARALLQSWLLIAGFVAMLLALGLKETRGARIAGIGLSLLWPLVLVVGLACWIIVEIVERLDARFGWPNTHRFILTRPSRCRPDPGNMCWRSLAMMGQRSHTEQTCAHGYAEAIYRKYSEEQS